MMQRTILLGIGTLSLVSCAHVAEAPSAMRTLVVMGEHYLVDPAINGQDGVRLVANGTEAIDGKYLVALGMSDGRAVLSVVNRTGECVFVKTQALRPGDGKVIESGRLLAQNGTEPTRASWSRDVAAVGVTVSEPRSCRLGFQAVAFSPVNVQYNSGASNTHGVP